MTQVIPESLAHEAVWWGACTNTWSEELKQISYARRMGLEATHDVGHYPAWDLQGRLVVDIGGGPCSMLLKCFNAGRRVVVDPCPYPDWVRARYEAVGIQWIQDNAEDVELWGYSEAWIYNVLQHVVDPALVVANARAAAKVLRIFEWIDIPADEKHPHVLTADLLAKWCGGEGSVEVGVNREWGETAHAAAWYGMFTREDA